MFFHQIKKKYFFIAGSAIYSGAQFGTVISMPLSGILAEHGFAGGWPSIFYVFGAIGVVWSLAFLWLCHEDPQSCPSISSEERSHIQDALGNIPAANKVTNQKTPYTSIATSLPFYAILFAHMGQNYGYETLMTELPTYMKSVLKFSLKTNGFLSALPFLAMWLCSLVYSIVADYLISRNILSIKWTRKLVNSMGQYGPAVCLAIAAYTGCDRVLTVTLLTIGVGMNGGIYSGFKINHLDISPTYAGILMALTNCTANLAGLLAPLVAGHFIDQVPSIPNWRCVFWIASGVYIFCATFYNLFSSGERQKWDKKKTDESSDREEY